MNKLKESFTIFPVGKIERTENKVYIQIFGNFVSALKQLEHFSHVQVLWWADRSDSEEKRNILETTSPYGENPPVTGIFATRAEYRPNPIALTTAKILKVNHEKGFVQIQDIDALDNSPVIDLKAYFPVCDRVKDAYIPSWITGWPEWLPEEGLGLM